MAIRRWFRERMAADGELGDDIPPNQALIDTILGRGEDRVRALGEYDSRTYPPDLRDMLARREEVTRDLLRMDVTDRDARVEAIPTLRDLLRKYPHPLVYETLIHAYLDSGRYDEARGVAFAARQRRLECARSEFPEVRAETDYLHDWSVEDIDALQRG